ncbi:MAG: ATP-binding protein [Magnetococcus sp. DMHC-6]
MNVIIGIAEVLAESQLTVEQQKFVTVFRRAGDNLLELINDILDLSKVEAGRLELDRVRFNLDETLERTMEIMGIRAKEKNLLLRHERHPNTPVWLLGDPKRLKQIFINLIGNAIKFTQTGSILIRVLPNPNSPHSGDLLFEVTDTGIGISAEKCETIFEAFTQADPTTTRKYGGTGLGLTITRRLVNLMQGEIRVKSRLGHGSTFEFTAHFDPVAESDTPLSITQKISIRGIRVLILDEQADSGLVLSRLAHSLHAQPEWVPDSHSALAMIQQSKKNQSPFQIAIISSPTGDETFLEEIRQLRQAANSPDLPVIGISSYHSHGFLAMARSEKILFLQKPIKRSELAECFQHAFNTQPSLSAPPDINPVLNLLLAEDSEDNILLFKAFLKKTPHHIDIVMNGQEALDKVKTTSYDVILMDMQMPIMDGYTATEEIRAWEKENIRPPVPIIALTAHAFEEDRKKTQLAGCTEHLTKPINKNILLETIERLGRGKN